MNQNQNTAHPNEIQVSILLTNSEATPASELSWVIRGFLCNACSHNLKGSAKRVTAHAIALRMLNSAHDTRAITFDEYQKITAEISEIEEHVYPGCSLI